MIKKVPFIVFIFLFLSKSKAQNLDFKNTFTLHYGASLFNIFQGNISPIQNDTLQFQRGAFSFVPTVGGTWDGAVKKWFSIGLAASYNNAKLSLDSVEYLKDNIGNIDIKVTRTTVAARFLIHYGNKNRFDCYSGFRIGAGIWKPSITSTISPKTAESILNTVFTTEDKGLEFGDGILERIPNKITFVTPQIQFIAFGLRAFITENIGVNGELGLGSPYFASIGLNYRFR